MRFFRFTLSTFSAILTYALPIITPSAPALAYFTASSADPIPKPAPTGNDAPVTFLTSRIAFSVYGLIFERKPVVPYTATMYKNPVETDAIFTSRLFSVFGDTRNTVQRSLFFASTIALGHKMNLDAYFKIVSSVRKAHPKTPLLMMTYANILYSRGYERICKEASDAGLDGFIVPDISPEDSKDYCVAAKKRDLCTVFLVSPNTEKSRLVKIASVSTGFLYMVAVYGTTGLRSKISPYTLKAIREVRKVTGASLPVGAGFGIGSADDAVKYAKAGADGVIIGSAYVRIAENVESVNLKKRTREFTRKVKSRLETIRADLVQ